MQNSSSFCRAQEAAQLKRANETDLQNVRQVALAAANVWRIEAEGAERREERSVGRTAVSAG